MAGLKIKKQDNRQHACINKYIYSKYIHILCLGINVCGLRKYILMSHVYNVYVRMCMCTCSLKCICIRMC